MYYLTIGTYDGVHLGHLKIIETLVKNSGGLKTLLLYFPIPPKFFLSDNINGNLITTFAEREKILMGTGIDRIEQLNFDKNLAKMHAEDFFKKILIDKYKIKGLIVGKDFAMGYMREGNLHFLEKKCREYNVDFKVIDFVRFEEHKISSSLIRNFLHKGEIEKANYCLSREYFLTGKVIKGAGLGKKIGFPTANLQVNPLKILPHGVFAVKVLFNEKQYKGVANIGFRPTFKTLGNKLIAEVHILDFDRDIYDEELTIFFQKKIRGEKKFKDSNELVENIKNDISMCLNLKTSIAQN